MTQAAGPSTFPAPSPRRANAGGSTASSRTCCTGRRSLQPSSRRFVRRSSERASRSPARSRERRDRKVRTPAMPSPVLDYLQSEGPPVYDPFCGGGSIPLEAQRLGLRAYASDLNPVPVLINKALIDIPHRFRGLAPVHPDVAMNKDLLDRRWHGAQGLAEDVRRFGQWVRDEARAADRTSVPNRPGTRRQRSRQCRRLDLGAHRRFPRSCLRRGTRTAYVLLLAFEQERARGCAGACARGRRP